MKYRKRPIVIEAFPVEHFFDEKKFIPDWAEQAYREGVITRVASEDALHIQTLEGVMRAGPNDYVIQGIKGELYPCARDIFLATYETVE